MLLISKQIVDLAVIGGGASGFMAAITAVERGLSSVCILESTSKTLEKVRISGGGRCNVTNACFDPTELVRNYPRGQLPLLGPFSRFATSDAVSWFAERGLHLIKEEDGRMFPVSNSSQDVVSCLRNAAKTAGVDCLINSPVTRLDCLNQKEFLLHYPTNNSLRAKKVLLATGGHPSGRKLATAMGHSIVKPVPSLFSFAINVPWLKSCSGLALDNIQIHLLVGGKSFQECGRVLITHKGLSGPAILRLSAFAARELSEDKYKGELSINWVGLNHNAIKNLFNDFRYKFASNQIGNAKPFRKLQNRFWRSLLKSIDINPSTRWAEFTIAQEKKLLSSLLSSSFVLHGRGPFGEEFVTAGGVKLREVQLSTMESRLCSGLHFAGELLDIDGVTGGFNFQHCWTSGWLAGNAIASSLNAN